MISNVNSDNKEISKLKEDIFSDLLYGVSTNENKKHVEHVIRSENIETAKQLLSNLALIQSINNHQCLILLTILSSDKNNGQEYIKRVIDIADDELIVEIAKDKDIYHNLSRENKNLINSRLNRNPWIPSNETIPL